MTRPCSKCRAISLKGLNDLGLQLLDEESDFDDLADEELDARLEEQEEWANSLFYLHHPSREELKKAREDGCHLCTLIDSFLDDKDEFNWLDVDKDQIFLVLPHHALEAEPSSKSFLTAHAGSQSCTLQIYLSGTEDLPVSLDYYCADSQNANTGTANALGLAAKWLSHCTAKHACGQETETVPELPTRVIDVGTIDSPRRALYIPSPKQCGNYMALSYCWGDPSKEQSFTTKLSDLKRPMGNLPSLARTLEQAIEVTRFLGCQYLWIDAICIIQDSEDDKNREIAKMGDIYRNATLTIAAAYGPDLHSGLYAKRDPVIHSPCALTINITKNGWSRDFHSIIRLKDQFPDIALHTRLWVLQEEILSPRTLLFRPDGLQWKCSQTILEEYDPIGARPNGMQASGMQTWISTQSRINGSDFPFEEWYELVKAHSRRSVKYLSDQLPAIAGIAAVVSRFHNRTDLNRTDLNQRYLAGLWSEDLTYGLSWYKHWLSDKHPKAKLDTHVEGYLAPSWSWASRPNGFTDYVDRSCVEVQHGLVELVKASCEPKSNTDGPFGKVAKGHLDLKGKIKPAKVRPVSNEHIRHHITGCEVLDCRVYGAWVSEVVDSGSGKIIGLITLDNQPDKSKTFDIWCLPILKMNRTARCCYDMLCLGLVKDGTSEGPYSRVGLIGLLKQLWLDKYREGEASKVREALAELSDEDNWSEREEVQRGGVSDEVQIWDEADWMIDRSLIRIV